MNIEQLKASAKNTVGYSEAENKESFLIGSSVGFSLSEKFYEKQITELNQQIEFFKTAYENVSGDMMTVTRIFSKYIQQD